MTPCDYLSMPYKQFLVSDPEQGGFTAGIEEFPGCLAEGETASEALENLNKVALAWLEVEIEAGHPIPTPSILDVPSHSGRVLLRLPPVLHRHAAEWAEKNNTSLNQTLVAAVSFFLGANEVVSTRGYTQIMAKYQLVGTSTKTEHTARTADIEN